MFKEFICKSIQHSIDHGNKQYCPNEQDFSPCDCGFGWIRCRGVPLISVLQLFKLERKRWDAYWIGTFHIILPIEENIIPDNLLGDHRVLDMIKIDCMPMPKNHTAQTIQVNQNAFKSSQISALALRISTCRLDKLDFVFLNGFHLLESLAFYDVMNVHLAHWSTLPPLKSLKELNIVRSTGLNEWQQFPVLINGLSKVNLGYNHILDVAMDRILFWLLINSPSAKTLTTFNIEGNCLTRIPAQLSSFPINKLFIRFNHKISSIRSKSFNFSHNHAIKEIYLSSNGIETIEPGAFQGGLLIYWLIVLIFQYIFFAGNFKDTLIDLSNNSLIRLDLSVFSQIFLQMHDGTGKINIDNSKRNKMILVRFVTKNLFFKQIQSSVMGIHAI